MNKRNQKSSIYPAWFRILSSYRLLCCSICILACSCSISRENAADPLSPFYTAPESVTPLAVLEDLPAKESGSANAEITVTGSGIDAYRYSHNYNEYSETTGLDKPIVLSDLPDGSHNIQVIARNFAGQWQSKLDATVYSWQVRAGGPVAQITNPPSTLSSLSDYSFDISAADIKSYRYRLDNGSWSDEITAGIPLELSALAGGVHAVEVIASDNLSVWQKEDEATVYTWTIDNTAPVLSSAFPQNMSTGVAPCSGNPCRAVMVLQFNESMNSSMVGQVIFEDADSFGADILHDSSAGQTDYSWSATSLDNDTLTITLSWIRFPENTVIAWTIPAAGLADTAGNSPAENLAGEFTTTAADNSFALAGSGVTGCYDSSGGIISCSSSTWPEQDGDNPGPGMNFDGPQSKTGYDGEYITRDILNNLTWHSCAVGKSGIDCSAGLLSTLNWFDAIDSCSAYNAMHDGNGYAGIKTWRLPTVTEYASRFDYSQSGARIDQTHFPAIAGVDFHTATGVSSQKIRIFTAGHYGPTTWTSNSKPVAKPLFCVSNDQPASRNYIVNPDNTVTDTRLNMTWQRCSRGQNNDETCSGSLSTTDWTTALQYCATLSLASKNWRLPSVRELYSLVDTRYGLAAVDSDIFPNNNGSYYFSATTSQSQTGSAHLINLYTGEQANGNKTGSNYVRCVEDQ